MLRNYLLTIITLLLALLCSLPIHAEEAEPTVDELFQIEYVIFTHRGNEQSEQATGNLSYQRAPNILRTHLIRGFEPLSMNQYPILDSGAMFLSDLISKLKRSRSVSVLSQGGWQQTILPESTLPPLEIDAIESTQTQAHAHKETRLEGTLTIKRSRYMHVDANLFLTDYIFYPEGDFLLWLLGLQSSKMDLSWMLTPYSPQEMLLKHSVANKLPGSIRKLQQSRRLKYGEIHYLDHPSLGLVITINKIERDEDSIF